MLPEREQVLDDFIELNVGPHILRIYEKSPGKEVLIENSGKSLKNLLILINNVNAVIWHVHVQGDWGKTKINFDQILSQYYWQKNKEKTIKIISNVLTFKF